MTQTRRVRAGWRLQRRIEGGENGSIVLALLAILMITMALALVASSVSSGQRQGRFDVSFERALQVSEDGLNQMVSLVQSNPSGPTSVPAVCSCTPCPIVGVRDCLVGTSGDGTYSATATKNGTSWTVDSTGRTTDGRSRHTRVEVRRPGLFNLAAFSRISSVFNGGKGADSFDSRTAGGMGLCGSTNSIVMCNPTHHGTIATNGELTVRRDTASFIDRMEITTSTGICQGVSDTCDLVSSSPPKLRSLCQQLR